MWEVKEKGIPGLNLVREYYINYYIEYFTLLLVADIMSLLSFLALTAKTHASFWLWLYFTGKAWTQGHPCQLPFFIPSHFLFLLLLFSNVHVLSLPSLDSSSRTICLHRIESLTSRSVSVWVCACTLVCVEVFSIENAQSSVNLGKPVLVQRKTVVGKPDLSL